MGRNSHITKRSSVGKVAEDIEYISLSKLSFKMAILELAIIVISSL
jgi:hypothetical protein